MKCKKTLKYARTRRWSLARSLSLSVSHAQALPAAKDLFPSGISVHNKAGATAFDRLSGMKICDPDGAFVWAIRCRGLSFFHKLTSRIVPFYLRVNLAPGRIDEISVEDGADRTAGHQDGD